MSKSSNETKDESKYRLNAINKEMKKSFPIVGIIIMMMVVALVLTIIGGNNITSHGIGNPYECKECHKLGFSCKEHRNYDLDKDLRNQIENIVGVHKIGEEIDNKDIYNGEEYNTKCDFCMAEKKECYNCEYNKKAIHLTIEKIYEDGVFSSRICADCWEKGYAICNIDRDYLSKEVYKEIKGED